MSHCSLLLSPSLIMFGGDLGIYYLYLYFDNDINSYVPCHRKFVRNSDDHSSIYLSGGEIGVTEFRVETIYES